MCVFDWVVPAGGVDQTHIYWPVEIFRQFMYQPMYQQNIDTPPEMN